MVTQYKIFALKKHYSHVLALMLFFATTGLHAQSVAFNKSGATGDPSAIVDMSGNSNLGFLMPAVTFTSSVDVTTIPSPVAGMIVFNPTSSTSNGLFGAGFYYWSGSQWLYLHNTGGLGVTSVAMTVPSIFNITGSPITSSGTFGVTLANQNANKVFAGPSTGSPATPTFRALATADLPTGIPNSNLANSSITVNGAGGIVVTGSPVSLGGTITVSNGSLTAISGAAESSSNTSVGGSGLYFTPNPITTTGSIGLAALSPSPAGTYGTAALMPQLTVNAEGQITSASTSAVAGGGSVTSIGASSTTGAQSGTSGLYFSSGSPLTSTGNLAIATAGVTNSMLANPTFTATVSAPLTGGGTYTLGSSTSIGMTTPLAISYGGTGTATAPIQYGVAYAATATTYSTTAAGATGSVLTSNATSAPTFQTVSSLVGNGYIKNNSTVTPQTANFTIQSAAAGDVGVIIEGAASQTADLLDLKNSTGTVIGSVDKSGNLTTQGLTSTGTVNINTTGAGVTTIGAGTNTSAVIIGNTTGNVGIGTAAPNALLNVNGAMGLGTASATTGTVTLYNSANTGSVSLNSGATATSYTLTLPTAQGGANTALTDNTSGTLSWATPSSALTVNNGLTLSGTNVQLGGALTQATDVAASSYPMAFDLGTGSAAGTGTFSVTNGGSGKPYIYATGNTTNNVPNVAIGNSAPGSNLLNVSAPAATSGSGNGINLTAQAGASGSSGGAVLISGGTGGSGAQGGTVSINAGTATGTANGANILLTPGALSGSGAGLTNGGVAINNTGVAPNPSALVDMATNTTGPAGGLLVPRLTADPSSTVEGMVYYNTTSNCFRFYSASLPGWQNLVCPCSGTPSAPTSVNGPTSVCVSSSYLFSISPVTGVSSYQWTAPSGATITSGQGTTTINVTMPSSTGTGTVSVTSENGCGYSSPTNLTVTIGSAPTGTGTISGTFTVCPSSSQSYSVSGFTGATYYIWTVPTGATLVGGQGTSSINITMGTSAGSVTCTPYSSAGGCPGTAVSSSISIISAPSAVGSISGPITGCNSTFVSTANTYSIAPVTGATSYSWSVNNTYATVTASVTNTVTITSAASAGSFTITATATNCAGSTSNTLAITSYAHLTQTFNYVSTVAQTITPPCCATTITVQLWGAGGGSGWYSTNTDPMSGGSGAYLAGVLTGMSGQTLTLYVPSGGGYSTSTSAGGGASGGWPGGGIAGFQPTYSENGGGGGGYAAISIGGTYYAVAGAGGGGGAFGGSDYGGGGGATTGGTGAIGGNTSAAGGGTVSTGGAAGVGPCTGTTATAGTSLQGGTGAGLSSSGCYAGGGGGGGYFGGGGAGSDGGGGGGGSSYPATNISGTPGFTITSNLAGTTNNAEGTASAPGSPSPATIGAGNYAAAGGNGQIIISY